MLLALILTAAIGADDSWLDEAAAHLKKSATEKRQAITSQLKEAKATKVTKTPKPNEKAFKTSAEKKSAVDALETKSKRSDAELALAFEYLPRSKLVVGSVGHVWEKSVRVVSVINPTSAVVEFRYFTGRLTDTRTGRVLGGDRVAEMVYLEASTKGWTDDTTLDFNDPVAVIGTKQVSGRTMLHAKALSEEDVSELKKRISSP